MLAERLREKVQSLLKWQETTGQMIEELEQTTQKIPEDIEALEEEQNRLKKETESRIKTEERSRIRDIENLKKEIAEMDGGGNPNAATKEELREVKTSVRKLAESLQTVKTVLGMKIQSEQKARKEDTQRLEDDIEEINKKIKPLLGKNDDDDDDDDNQGVHGRHVGTGRR